MQSFYDWIYGTSMSYLSKDLQSETWYIELSVVVGDMLKVMAVTLCICCFLAGLIYSSSDALSARRPEGIIKSFFRLVISYFLIQHTSDAVFGILGIVNSLTESLAARTDAVNEAFDLASHAADVIGGSGRIPIVDILLNLFGFIFNIVLILIFIILGILILVSVYGKLFKVAMYTLVAPLPFATFSSLQTSRAGKGYLRSYISVCLEMFAVMLVLSMMSIIIRNNGGALQFFNFSADASVSYSQSSTGYAESLLYLNGWTLNMDILMLVTLSLVKGVNVITRDWMGV